MKIRILTILFLTVIFICAVLLKTQAEKLRACEARQGAHGKVVAVHPDGRTVVELPYGWLVIEQFEDSTNFSEGDCIRFDGARVQPVPCE